MAKDGYVKEAFLSQYNLIALAGAVALSLVLMSPMPLVVAAGAECLYLGVVPSVPGFQRAVRRRRRREREEQEEKQLAVLLEELSPSQREAYHALRDLRDKTTENYARLPGGGILVESSSARLDGLLTSFVKLLGTLNNYRRYLNSTDLKALERELAELRVELAGGAAGPESVQEVKRRRVEILEKRLERFHRSAESRELISHQLASIEDFMRLLHEQSITIRDPEVVNAQLDSLSVELQATDETLRQMERISAFEEEMRTLPQPTRVR